MKAANSLRTAVVGVFLAALLQTSPAKADSATVVNTAPFTSGRSHTSAVWTGAYGYIFGGNSGGTDIVRYDAVTNTTTLMGASFPTSVSRTGAVWIGSSAYIFGGSTIYRYNPSADLLTVMAATLPHAVFSPGAAADGTYAYLLGGGHRRIQRYDPATDSVIVMSAQLPFYVWDPNAGYSQLPAIFDGTHIYTFAGRRGSWYTNQIVKFDPVADTASVALELPWIRWGQSAIWDGRYAFLFGGGDEYGRAISQIARYDPVANVYTIMSSSLSSARANSSAVWTSGHALIFGGSNLNQAVRYDITPGPPLSPKTTRGPGRGQITFSWSQPASNSYSDPPSSYRIYKGTSAGEETLLVELDAQFMEYVDAGLPDSSTFYYRVSTVSALGEGTKSNSLVGETPTVPSIPQYLKGKRGPAAGQITLTWELPSDSGGIDESGYFIYRGIDSSSLARVGIAGTDRSFVDGGLSHSTTYYYAVSAFNDVGEGPRSPIISSTSPSPPSAPSNVRVIPYPQQRASTVYWDTPSSTGGIPITFYRVYIYSAGKDPARYYYYDTDYGGNAFIDWECRKGNVCYYQVTAWNDTGESPRSGTAWGVGVS